MSMHPELEAAANAVASKVPMAPVLGVVLGSGLGSFADSLHGKVVIPYRDIPFMPVSTVVGHAGNLCFGTIAGTPIACLQGRVHLYEGHSPDRVVFGVRLLAQLGCQAVLLTNAAGGIKAGFQAGDLMLVTDHLNLMGKNPLAGPNDERFGPRFPDLTRAYDPELRHLAKEAATELRLDLREGVYAGLLGPSYETPAEISMMRILGADAVGMSTVPEVIALRHRGVRVAAISCITNLAAGISPTPLSHAEVEETARHSRDRFVSLLTAWIRKIVPAIATGH